MTSCHYRSLFSAWLSVNDRRCLKPRLERLRRTKKPRESLRRVRFPEQKHRGSPAVVSPAAAKSLPLLLRCLHAGTSRQLNRLKLSRVTQPDPPSGPS